MKKQVMIDLETFGTRPDSIIVSIGAVKFNDEKVFDEFKINVDPRSCKALGMTWEKDTVDWWDKQSEEAKADWKKDPLSLPIAIQRFDDWYGKDKIKWVWGNGAIFDIAIMEHAYRTCGIMEPWKFWDVMCLRTVSNLSGVGVPRVDGVHHTALDDARNQALYLIKMLKGEK